MSLKEFTMCVDTTKLLLNTNDYLIIGENVKGSSKIAAFDLDSTIIETKSGNVFAKDIHDWKIMPNVKEKLLKLYEDNYKIVIFTNQSGIKSGKITKESFFQKIQDIVEEIGIPIQIFVSTSNHSYFRKPAPGMWYLLEQNNSEIKINKNDSFYVGDAAGRPKRKDKKKDFSDSDLKFALNIGLTFYTEDHYFKGYIEKLNTPIHPLQLLKDTSSTVNAAKLLLKKEQEIILFVGPPASGKSSYTSFFDYVIVSNDIQGTSKKVIHTLYEALNNSKSVIIDNTNSIIKGTFNEKTGKGTIGRDFYVNIAKTRKIPIRVLYFNIEKELSIHLNEYRRIISLKDVPNIAIHKFYKNIKEQGPPTLDEGFNEIIEVPFKLNKHICNEQLIKFYLI